MTAGDRPPDLVVLEPAPRGHGREWLLHLARHALGREAVPRLTFVVARPVAETLRADLAGTAVPGLRIVSLGPREQALCTHRRLAVSALARWWTMRRHLAQHGARHGLFLEFDHLTLPMAMRLPLGAGRTVSGILFRPSVHYRDGGGTLAERFRDLRKSWLYRLMLGNRAVRQVHTLDDAFPAFARASYPGGGKVTALPDPAHPPLVTAEDDRALASRAPLDRRLFVLFGVLSERKGVLALLRALALLAPPAARRMAVIIGGEVEPGIQGEVERLHAALRARQPDLWLHIEARFLRSGEICALIERAHAVLAPYQRFVGSSGVLMWAASRDRPVIAQDYGLVGRLVRENRLGLTADTSDPGALARALSRAAAEERRTLADAGSMAAFAGRMTPDAFSAAVLSPVCREAERRHPAGRATAGAGAGQATVSSRSAAAPPR